VVLLDLCADSAGAGATVQKVTGRREDYRVSKDDELNPIADAREQIRRMAQTPQPQVFTAVKDRDLVTLMDQFAGSLEFHSMLVAAQLMREVSSRNLWDAVLERRAALLARAVESADPEKLRQQAKASLDRFRDEHFPVDPDLFDEPDGPAAEAWNSYIQF
jgi:hypothetical protein